MEAITDAYGVAVYKERFNFCSAHFLLFADGSREDLHGHNYRAWVELEGELGDGDIVLDFTVLKPIVSEACNELDHKTLIAAASPYLQLEDLGESLWVRHTGGSFCFPKRDVLLLPLRNTSTELLASYLHEKVAHRLRQIVPNAQFTRFRVSVEESSGQCGFFERRRKLA
jgi:6-pyruvoyltetrahydropterin/6-carboxytetrahydropterin synthase